MEDNYLNEEHTRPLPGYLFEGLFTFVGIVVLTVCVCINISSRSFLAQAAPTDAVILTMHQTADGLLGTPLVEYEADGKRYVGRLNMATSDMKPGGHITVHYNKNNPRDVRYTGADEWLTLIFIGVGIILTALGMFFTLVRRNRLQNRRSRSSI